ncbi:hypothetical protein [Klebsiella pneumoniae IS39]|nr:hypothetical protein [Klebsiella pneumoniae IS39]
MQSVRKNFSTVKAVFFIYGRRKIHINNKIFQYTIDFNF